MPETALAVTLHDPGGHTRAAIERLSPRLQTLFAGIAVNASDATDARALDTIRAIPGVDLAIHPASEATIGKVRRASVGQALSFKPDCVLYSDLDHMLRWAEYGYDDLQAILACQQETEFLVVGRSGQAFAAEPRRLQETERWVNHTFELLTGHRCDLMFAVRRMSHRAARHIAENSEADTLANDVEWPLLALDAGFSFGHTASDALFYRTIEEFGADADSRDGDPLEWIRRIEFAALQAGAIRRFLRK